MKTEFNSFLKKLLIFSGILGIIALILFFFLPRHFFTPVLPLIFVFFILVTLLSYYLLLRIVHVRFIRFVNYFMLSTFVKLILYIAILVLYIFLNKKDAVPFALSFFILYIFYTFFEISAILTYSKKLQ
ncbi:MAG: hypothetical protein Q8867_03555 [Bacteroidota bacterium]|nr:hypothetical protein [Bacteroidota bacterium]